MEKINKEQWDAVINQTYELEFDWIAFDQIYQIAVFSSFNKGYISDKAKLSFELYQELFNLIESLPLYTTSILVTKEKGIFNDWQCYSKKGLYAFDYQDIHRSDKLQQYDLISKPKNPLIASQIKDIGYFFEIIPQYDLVFSSDISFQQFNTKER